MKKMYATNKILPTKNDLNVNVNYTEPPKTFVHVSSCKNHVVIPKPVELYYCRTCGGWEHSEIATFSHGVVLLQS